MKHANCQKIRIDVKNKKLLIKKNSRKTSRIQENFKTNKNVTK